MTQFLIDATTAAADRIGIEPERWSAFMEIIDPLRTHAESMYEHSLRVGLYSCGLAIAQGMDTKFALFGGCGHDVGKCFVPHEVLYSKEFGPREREAVNVHCEAGFAMLAPTNLYAAFIAGLHHQFQENPYGIDLDEVSPYPLSSDAKDSINAMGQLVATADFFDAYTTRNGQKSDDEVWAAMQRFSPARVDWLLENGWDWLQ